MISIDTALIHDLTPRRLASTLAQINRWGGRMPVPYNVARHSIDTVRLAREAGEPRSIQYECLMHDATEAVVGDVISILKAQLPDYVALERRVRALLADRWQIEVAEPNQVMHYDLMARDIERAYLLSGLAREEPWAESRDRWGLWYMRLAPEQAPHL